MRQTSRLVGVLLVVLLGGLAWLAVDAVAPPDVVPASAPADQFSGERAFQHVAQIGQQVHVAGSDAAGEVRQYIVDTLTSYGLDPEIQQGVGATDALGGFAMAAVSNVVARIPGTAPTSTLFLVAHYDSVQISYGANDDGAGTSALLETARALSTGGPLRNDVVFVFTDAEEACLCGAEAFMSQDPLAAAGGVVLNFESRGSSGPAIMFETTRGNAGLVSLFADAVPYPVATSFAVEVYRILPNDTDFSPFRDSGRFTGLNSAYIDGSATYHTPEDRPEYMDQRSLQHLGGNALAMATALGAADLSTVSAPGGGDATYFPVLGTLITYPGWLVWPIALLALAAVVGAGLLALRRGLVGGGRLAAGFGLALIPLVAGPVSAQLLWSLLKLIRPGYVNMIDPWSPGWFRAAVVALVATVLLTWYALLRRRIGGLALSIGALGWLAVLGVVLAAVTPGGSYLAALPALAGGLAALVAIQLRGGVVATVGYGLAGAVAVLVLAPTVMLFFPALGLEVGGAAALFATMLGMALLPLLDALFPAVDQPTVGVVEPTRGRLAGWLTPLVALGLTVVFTVTGFVVDRFDAAHPAPVQLMYALDTDTEQAFWVRPGSDPSGWSDQFVSTEQDLSGQFPMLPSTATVGQAQPADLPPAEVTSTSVENGENRTVTVTITPQRDVRLVLVEVPDATVLSATAAGRAVPSIADDEPFRLLFHAPPERGLVLELELAGSSPATLRVMDGSDGLDGLPGFVPRPDGVGKLGSHTSELVLVAKNHTI